MFNHLVLICPTDPQGLAKQAEALRVLYPWVAVGLATVPDPDSLVLDTARWRARDFDPVTLDIAIDHVLRVRGGLTLQVSDRGSAARCGQAARQVMTRYQRLCRGTNEHSATPLFDRVLGLHRDAHDLQRPLVAADHDHALDTWRWTLRLDPAASLAAQLAALLHDIERLDSEGEVRIEQHSPDYLAFKTAHAAGGARRARRLLADALAPQELIDRVAELIRGHEQPGDDPESLLINDADALSFFSLNACGFISYYGPEHTRKKIRYTLDRLSPRGWGELTLLRQRADLQALLDQVLLEAPVTEVPLTEAPITAPANPVRQEAR